MDQESDMREVSEKKEEEEDEEGGDGDLVSLAG